MTLENQSELEVCHSQSMKLLGNITNFLEVEDEVTKAFVRITRKVQVKLDSDLANKSETPWSSSVVKRCLTKLEAVYNIAKSLSKKYRWVTRTRITEKGRDYNRVNLDKHRSVIITLDDLQLEKPLREIIRVSLEEVSEEIDALLRVKTTADTQV